MGRFGMYMSQYLRNCLMLIGGFILLMLMLFLAYSVARILMIAVSYMDRILV